VRRPTLAACLTMVVLAAGPASAQAPSPDAMAAARELIVTMRAADNFKAILPAIVKNLKPAIVQNRPDVERDYDAIMPLILARPFRMKAITGKELWEHPMFTTSLGELLNTSQNE